MTQAHYIVNTVADDIPATQRGRAVQYFVCSDCSYPNIRDRSIQHCSDVIMGEMASQMTSLTIVYLTAYSGADRRKHQNPTSLAFVRGIHRWPVNSPHNGPVTRKRFPFDDFIMGGLFLVTFGATILVPYHEVMYMYMQLIWRCDTRPWKYNWKWSSFWLQ